MIYSFILLCILVYVLTKLLKDPLPLCGIYSQPGKYYYIKYWAFRLIYKLRRAQKLKLKLKKNDANSGAGYGVKAISDINELDKPQPLPEDAPEAVDAVYFNASNEQGYYIVVSAARRHKKVVQSMLMIRIPGEDGVLELPIAPHTSLTCDSENENEYSAGRIVIKPVTAMQHWTIDYDGLLHKSNDRSKVYKAHLSCHWRACTGYFDFDADMHPHVISEAMAREPWSREFFERLAQFHQTHYEQFGDVEVSLSLTPIINGQQTHPKSLHLNLRGLRDHSFGKIRDWNHLYRYALHLFQLQDGTCFNLSCVCMPGVALSKLDLGFVYEPNGRKLVVLDSQLNMDQLGNDGKPMDVFQFQFTAVDPNDESYCKKYDVQVEIVQRNHAYFGEDWEGRVCEQMARCVVNGKIKGTGFAEWQWRNICGKRNIC